jgi:energy-coupling factor transport system permease protein
MALLKDITLGQYYPGNSFLHNLDPRSKIVGTTVFLCGLLVADSVSAGLVFALCCIAGIILSGIPFGVFWGNLKSFTWFLAFVFLVHLLLNEGGELVAVLPMGLRITDSGITTALLYTTKLVLLLLCTALLTLTTIPVDFTDGLERLCSPLRRLGVPVHDIAMMISLSLRFIPLLLQETERLKNAQISRGASFHGHILNRCKAVSAMLLPLFVSAFRRADELAVAMEARCYADGSVRSSYRTLVFGTRDYLFITCIVLILPVLFFDKF